jgi:uncharacterized protein YqjF (DUF2071 family)
MIASDMLRARLQPPKTDGNTVDTVLRHFCLINYAVDPKRLQQLIPADRFRVMTFDFGNGPQALVSAVPFFDEDFHFEFLPSAKISFFQTNYRAYVTDIETGEPVVWFFGTTLGHPIVEVPRRLWKIPWHFARYSSAIDGGRIRLSAHSDWSPLRLDLELFGGEVASHRGFPTEEEFRLILTHPVQGFYHGLDGHLGTYSVCHELIPLREARVNHAHFGIFERLGLLTKAEMKDPLSALVCDETRFKVLLPPQRVRWM